LHIRSAAQPTISRRWPSSVVVVGQGEQDLAYEADTAQVFAKDSSGFSTIMQFFPPELDTRVQLQQK
jgi:hypothetical protein